MKKTILTLAALAATTPVFAQGFDLNKAMQAAQQMAAGSTGTTTTAAANPLAAQAQQAIVQQALQQLANNPQLLTQLAGSLTPQQQATLTTQALGVAQQNLTKAEQAKLTAFTASPEGASIAAKLPQIVQQLAPTLLQMYAGNSAANLAPAAGK